VECADAPPVVKKAFLGMRKSLKNAFADPNEALPQDLLKNGITTQYGWVIKKEPTRPAIKIGDWS